MKFVEIRADSTDFFLAVGNDVRPITMPHGLGCEMVIGQFISSAKSRTKFITNVAVTFRAGKLQTDVDYFFKQKAPTMHAAVSKSKIARKQPCMHGYKSACKHKYYCPDDPIIHKNPLQV